MDLPTNYRDWTILIAMVLVIIGVGYFALNGFLDYRYKAEFLGTPCELCLKLNTNVDICPRQIQIDYNTLNVSFPKVNG